MSDDSFDNLPCACGRDIGDGIDCCTECKQYSCGKCAVPSLVKTDQGWYCADCLKEIILIKTEKASKYKRCKLCNYGYDNFVYAGLVMCSSCLEQIVRRYKNEEHHILSSDSDDEY
jgi:hypothetical protein